jgi:hypothetical protein
MENAAVMAALMAADARFLFEHRYPHARKSLLEPVRGCQSDDSSAHHRDRSRHRSILLQQFVVPG